MSKNTDTVDRNRLSGAVCRADSRVNGWVAAIPGWWLIFVGAITIALVDPIVEALPIGETAETPALMAVVLALVYGQLAVLAWYYRRYGRT